MRRTVLFVNTRPSPVEAEPCFRAARRLGLDVVLLADRAVAVPEGAYSEHVEVDTYDTAAVVETAQALAGRRDVAGVVCWGDRDVEAVAAVAEVLGLPGNSPEAAALARNKGAFRDRLAATAPDLSVRHLRLRGNGGIDADTVARVGFPAIVKPAGASASKGIFKVHDAAELSAAIAQLDAYTRPEVDPIFRYYGDELILEEYVEGSEHSVEGLMRDGRLEAAAVTDKWVEPDHSLEYLQVHPSALSPERQAAAVEAAGRAAAAIGLGTGAFHLELRVRPDGSIRVLELNARTGGGYIASHLIPLSRGYDFLAATLRLACRLGPAGPMPAATATAGSYKVLARRPGRLEGIGGADRAIMQPGVVAMAIERPLGAEVLVPPDGYTESALASLIAVGYSPGWVVTQLEAAAAALSPRIAEVVV